MIINICGYEINLTKIYTISPIESPSEFLHQFTIYFLNRKELTIHSYLKCKKDGEGYYIDNRNSASLAQITKIRETLIGVWKANQSTNIKIDFDDTEQR